MNAKIAHLTFIQGVINRMGANTLAVKGWTFTLVTVIFSLSAKDANHNLALIALLPILPFWALDAFFLYQEKLFRKLYTKVATGSIGSDEFSLDTSPLKASVSYIGAIISKTIWPFYALTAILVAAGTIILNPLTPR